MPQKINELQLFVVSAFRRARYDHKARAEAMETESQGQSANGSVNPFADEPKQEDDWLKLAQKEGSIEKCWATSLNAYEDNYAFYLAMYLYLYSEQRDWTLGYWLLENLCDMRQERMAMHRALEQDQRQCVGVILRDLSANRDLDPDQERHLMMAITDFWEADLPMGAPPVHHDRTYLENQIRAAFDGVQLEDGVSLHKTIYLDNYRSASEELLEQIEADEREDWTKLISDPELQRVLGTGGWSFFDFNGFRFHLPAYLISDLHNAHYSDLLIIHLTKTNHHCSHSGCSLAHFDLLTNDQRNCVALFLKNYRDLRPSIPYPEHEINRSLWEYWNKSRDYFF